MQSPPQHILIIRLSAIGDIVFTSCLIPAIKTRYPQCHISWLIEPMAADIIRHHPDIDHLIIWNKQETLAYLKQGQFFKAWQSIAQIIKTLKSLKIDWVIDAQGLLKSGLWAWFSGAKYKISLGGKEGSRYFMSHSYPRNIGDPEQIASEYLGLAQALGLAKTEQLSIIAPKHSLEKTKDIIINQSLDPYIIIAPFTTRPQKHWFDHYWQSLIQALIQQKYSIILLGGPGDISHAQQLIQDLPVYNLVGKTKLYEAIAWIQQACLVIGVDTGLTHIGYAVKTPTIALFGSTRPYLKTLQSPGKVLFKDLSCAPCKRHPTCQQTYTCMQELSFQEVLDAALFYLKS